MNTENDTEKTMAEVNHTNPYTGETAGRLFSRGPTVVTDGGEPSDTRRTTEDHGSSGREPTDAVDGNPAATDAEERTDGESQTMADVEHTPPHDADDANRVFERGREPTVEEEE